MGNDKYKALTAREVTDLELLPGRFDSFAAEIRLSLEILTSRITDRIIPMLERIDSRLRDMEIRIDRLEQGHADLEKRVAALEKGLKQ